MAGLFDPSPRNWSSRKVTNGLCAKLQMAQGEDQRMAKKHFTKEQIVSTLREAESGVPIVEVCRRLGVTETTFLRWRKQFAGMAIAELRRLKQLEDENKRLKTLVAALTLDKSMLQEVIRKKL